MGVRQQHREGALTRRDGVALAVVVLVCVALAALGHAVLLIVRTEAWIVRADARRMERDYASAAALAHAAEHLDSLVADGASSTPYGIVKTHRLSVEVGLLTSEGGSAGGRARILYAPHAAERLRRRAAGVRIGGSIRIGAQAVVLHAPDESRAACPDGVAVSPAMGLWDPALDGEAVPRLGPVGLLQVQGRLPTRPGGDWLLGPVTASDGSCLGGSANWGDPARPGGACAGVWGRGSVTGDVTLAGSGQGLLAVDGSLSMADGARFRGWVLVSGDLRMGVGARLTGLADAGGDVLLESAAALQVDACSAALALERAPELRTPWTLGPPAWPVF
jgi:hypothetical protein